MRDENFSSHGDKQVPFLPILIIPGFMSSSLQVEHSDLKENWIGKRVWLSLPALGFEAFKWSSRAPNAKRKSSQTSADSNKDATNINGGTLDNLPSDVLHIPSNMRQAASDVITEVQANRRGETPLNINNRVDENKVLSAQTQQNSEPPQQQQHHQNIPEEEEDLEQQFTKGKDDDDDDDDDIEKKQQPNFGDSDITDPLVEGTTTDPIKPENINDRMLRNMWIRHMSLEDDMTTEHEGIRIRAIPGLNGVDYLATGPLRKLFTYVFGPLVNVLKKAGYQEGVNLDAAPYDWRLSYRELERRDQYFTRTLQQIENLYRKNNNTAVVLVCHSMGCRVGHYLLNFALRQKGQEWLDTRIHTFCCIGAPHIGASKSLRGLISGDKMGLEAFLTDEDALVVARSWGSTPSLLPTTLPPSAAPCVLLRKENAMQFRIISPIDTDVFLNRREDGHRPSKLKLLVTLNGVSISTPYRPIDADGKVRFLNDAFTFRTKVHDEDTVYDSRARFFGRLAIYLCEPGVSTARNSTSKTRRGMRRCRANFFARWRFECCGTEDAKWGRPPKDKPVLCFLNYLTFWWLIWPIVRYSVEFGFKIAFGATYAALWCVYQGTVLSADEISKLTGGSSALAVVKIRNLEKAPLKVLTADEKENNKKDKNDTAVIRREYDYTKSQSRMPSDEPVEVELDLKLVSCRDKRNILKCCGEKRKTTITLSVTSIPPFESTSNNLTICEPNSSAHRNIPELLGKDSSTTLFHSAVSSFRGMPSSKPPRDDLTNFETDPKAVLDEIDFPIVESSKKKRAVYGTRSGLEMLNSERLTTVLDNIATLYDEDPLDPRGLSAVDPPPVRNVKAIYGINLPTEIGAVYKRPPKVYSCPEKLESFFRVDGSASSPPPPKIMGDEEEEERPQPHIVVKNGIIYEQPSRGSQGSSILAPKKSGDGTVPYWSLSHVKTWEKDCQVSVHELEASDHRDILIDKRLHKILLDYCSAKTSVTEDTV